jgi:hypothetical protein
VKLALPARLVQPAPRAHKASKDPSVPRAPSASAGRLALPDRPDRSDRRARRVKPVAKAQSDPAANVDRQDRRAPLAQPARPDRRARRVTPARHRQFGSSPVRIAFAAETTKSWLVLFARAVRPTERSARLPARQQPGYVYVGDLGHRVATSSTFSKQKSFNASSPAHRETVQPFGASGTEHFDFSLSTQLRLTLEIPPRSSLRPPL